MKTWPQSLPFRPSMPPGSPSRVFAAAVLVSMAVHAILAYLLCAVVADRTAIVKPGASSIGTPLIVSLASPPMPATASRDGTDREAVPAVPPARDAQSPPESARGINRNAETGSVVASKDREAPGSTAPPAAPPSIDAAAAYGTPPEVVMIPEFETGIFLASKAPGGMGAEIPAGKYPAPAPPSFNLDAAYGIAGEAGGSLMTEFELQDLRFKYRELYLKNHLGITKEACRDCRTYYAGGLLAIPFLLKDSITNSGCTWEKLELRERQVDLGRQKDQERRDFFSSLVNELIIETP